MHSLAISLIKSGYQITGSDDKIYDPSLTRLKKYDILPNDIHCILVIYGTGRYRCNL